MKATLIVAIICVVFAEVGLADTLGNRWMLSDIIRSGVDTGTMTSPVSGKTWSFVRDWKGELTGNWPPTECGHYPAEYTSSGTIKFVFEWKSSADKHIFGTDREPEELNIEISSSAGLYSRGSFPLSFRYYSLDCGIFPYYSYFLDGPVHRGIKTMTFSKSDVATGKVEVETSGSATGIINWYMPFDQGAGFTASATVLEKILIPSTSIGTTYHREEIKGLPIQVANLFNGKELVDDSVISTEDGHKTAWDQGNRIMTVYFSPFGNWGTSGHFDIFSHLDSGYDDFIFKSEDYNYPLGYVFATGGITKSNFGEQNTYLGTVCSVKDFADNRTITSRHILKGHQEIEEPVIQRQRITHPRPLDVYNDIADLYTGILKPGVEDWKLFAGPLDARDQALDITLGVELTERYENQVNWELSSEIGIEIDVLKEIVTSKYSEITSRSVEYKISSDHKLSAAKGTRVAYYWSPIYTEIKGTVSRWGMNGYICDQGFKTKIYTGEPIPAITVIVLSNYRTINRNLDLKNPKTILSSGPIQIRTRDGGMMR